MALEMTLAAKVSEWRNKARDGTMTLDDMREAITALRAGRISASVKSSTSRAKKAPVDTGSMLAELGIGGPDETSET
jgi:hypothetical protein